jgi:hypothetical protein
MNWFIWIFKVDGKILFWFQILWPNFLTIFFNGKSLGKQMIAIAMFIFLKIK